MSSDFVPFKVQQPSIENLAQSKGCRMNRHGQNDPEIVIGRPNWLLAGSRRAGKRAAAVMSLIQPARMNRHDPPAYLTDILSRLLAHKASRIGELLSHRSQPIVATT